MAKAELSPMFQSIRGKIGNGVFQVWKGIQIIKQMPKVISQPQSGQQATVRNLLVDAQAAYNALSGNDRDTWNEMAEVIKDFPMPPGGIENLIPGLGGPMSGANCYVSFYMSARLQNFPVPATAPLSEQRPNAPTNIQTSWLSPDATITWVDPTVSEAGAQVRVWLVSRQRRIYHKQHILNVALAVQTVNITAAKSAKGSNIAFDDVLPTRLFVQMDTVNPSGFRSQPSQVRGLNIV